METYSKWEPLEGIVTPCAQIDLHIDASSYRAILRFAYITEGLDRDLELDFGTEVMAVMSHDEFAHPWAKYGKDSAGSVPRLDGRWKDYSFPLLRVKSSIWESSFTDSQILDFQRVRLQHVRLVSLDNTVDILTQAEASATWMPADPSI